jgi:hypothetical protein
MLTILPGLSHACSNIQNELHFNYLMQHYLFCLPSLSLPFLWRPGTIPEVLLSYLKHIYLYCKPFFLKIRFVNFDASLNGTGLELTATWSEKTVESSLEMAELENASPHEAEKWMILPFLSPNL